jgi:hypothetical protein
MTTINKIPDDILLYTIKKFIREYNDFVNIMNVCKRFRRICMGIKTLIVFKFIPKEVEEPEPPQYYRNIVPYGGYQGSRDFGYTATFTISSEGDAWSYY